VEAARKSHIGPSIYPPRTGATALVGCWRVTRRVLANSRACSSGSALAYYQSCDDELKTLSKRMSDLLSQSPASVLLEQRGIGPVTAAVALTTWSHLGRVRSEAAFASLAGANPIPASSGNTVRHRLNRGGDRRLNRALHMAIVTRMRMDPDTRAYGARRTAQGRTPPRRSAAASSATSPARSTASSTPPPRTHAQLDKHRRFNRCGRRSACR